ncbi:hypothetical protein ACH40F_19600 [Streptomyces sp. NPDC020794]|uniref:hypothetical protein n=1 Tax=unclassified Streptomyces TaxID=2593676 RepID=UPI0036F01653
MASELDQTREDVLAARSGEDSQTETEIRAEWQGRVRRLLHADPSVADELQALLDELSPPDTTSGNTVQMRAHATGNGRVYQAGRDQHIQES